MPYLETAAAAVWWTLGAAALGGGLSTVVLAAGLGDHRRGLVVALRRRYGSGEPLSAGPARPAAAAADRRAWP